jgi:hypothetical protein
MSSFTPFPSASSQDREENEFWLDRELSLIQNALEDQGEMKRGDLGKLLGCRYWGPRRFAHALKAGVEQGRFRRVSRGRYGPIQ